MDELTGKVALVTGASKGIGAEIAKGLAAAGAAVVVNYASSKEGAEKVVAEIQAQGGRAVAVQADVSRSGDRQRLLAQTKEAFGGLDVLVNNAAVYRFDPLEAVTEEELQRQFGTNVFGPILLTREAVPHFGPAGGSVINIGSVTSASPVAGSVVYSASKGAVDTVTKVLAKELGPRKIRVNSINPGGVDTPGNAGAKDSDFGRQMVARTPLGRFGEPTDIAPVAVFLASPSSGWMTGEILLASGGFPGF